MSEDVSWAYLLEAIKSSPTPIEATPLYTREGQPSNLLVNNIPSQALDKNVFDLPSKEDEEVYIPAGHNFDDFPFEGIDPQQHSNNIDKDFLEVSLQYIYCIFLGFSDMLKKKKKKKLYQVIQIFYVFPAAI